MRRYGIFILLFLASVAVEAAQLSTDRLLPAPGPRNGLVAASNGSGYLAAWADGRFVEGPRQLVVARFDAAGRLLDPEGLPTGIDATGWAPDVVASDGSSYLVISQTNGVRVTADGAMQRFTLPLEHVRGSVALAWTGRRYLYAYQVGSSGSYVRGVLLERDGTPAGDVELPSDTRFVTCDAGQCLVLAAWGFGGFVSDDGASGGTFRSMFGGLAAVGKDAEGIYVVRHVWPKGLGIERLESPGPRTRPGRQPDDDEPPSWRKRLVIQLPHYVGDVVTDVHDGSIYVAYSTDTGAGVLRFDPNGTITSGISEGKRRYAPQLVVGPAGPLLLWREEEYGQYRYEPQRQRLFFAKVDGDAWRTGGALLSRSRPFAGMPKLVRGATGFLALWVEGSDHDELMAMPLDLDGRPRGPATVIASAHQITDFAAGSNGTQFLVAWIHSEIECCRRYRLGRLLGELAVPIGEAFSIQPDDQPGLAGSVVWERGSFLVSNEYGLSRIAPSGTELDLFSVPLYGTPYIAPTTTPGRYVALQADVYQPPVGTPPRADYTPMTIDLDGVLERTAEFSTWWMEAVAPAVAVLNDHPIRIVCDGDANRLRLLDQDALLPYRCDSRSRSEHADRIEQIDVATFANDYIIASRSDIGLHAADSSLVRTYALSEDVLDSAIGAVYEDALIVLVQRRGEGQLPIIESLRLPLRVDR